jgi:hypothetical protein
MASCQAGSYPQYTIAATVVPEGCVINGINNTFYLTFVGTGIDVLCGIGTTASNFTNIFIDNVLTSNTCSMSASQTPTVFTLASGLAYGTHTITMFGQASSLSPSIIKFIVYQPKTPAVPANALLLSTYNVMANYTASSGSAGSTRIIAPGVLRKTAIREWVYNGSGSWTIVNNSGFSTGGNLLEGIVGAFAEYTFFGTGFELRGSSSPTAYSNSVQVAVDGAVPGGTSSILGNWTYTSGTGVLSQVGSTGFNGNALSISGLTLGLHTVRLTNNATNSGVLNIESIDIITPIYERVNNYPVMYQSVASIGSNSLGDQRATGFFAPNENQGRVVALSSPVSGNAPFLGATGANVMPLADMGHTIFMEQDGIAECAFYCISTQAVSADANQFFLFVDGLQYTAFPSVFTNSTAFDGYAGGSITVPLCKGYHRIDVYWLDGAGNGATVFARSLTVNQRK